MRILHIGLSSIRGGIESFTEAQANELYRQGVIFDYADIYGGGICISTPESRVYTLPSFKRHPRRVMRELTALMASGSYDCVHIHLASEANTLPLRAARAAGIHPVLHLHFSSSNGILRRLAHTLFGGIFNTLPAHRVCPTESSGKWFFKSNDFTVLKSPVSTERFRFDAEVRRTVRGELGISDDCILFGYIGRLERVKNPLFALEVLKALTEKYKSQAVRLLIIGDGSLSKSLDERARALGLDKYITRIPYTERVNEYLFAMDSLIMPSKSEGLSLVAVEAQCAGVPVIFADTVPYENKILENSLILPASAEKFADEISRRNTSLTKREQAYESFKNSEYDIRTSSGMLLSIYKGLCQGGKK